MKATRAAAWTASEPLLRPDPPAVSRHPALERGFGVLLVDDDAHHRIPLLRALRDQGHRVLYAPDGASGETLCRTAQLEIDALVACADMKSMCGFELARRVLRMRPEVRVLLMGRQSAGAVKTHRACERAYAVIEEPFTPEELCRRLSGLLGPHAMTPVQNPVPVLKSASSRARTNAWPSVPTKTTGGRRRSIHGTERRPRGRRRPVRDRGRGTASGELHLV